MRKSFLIFCTILSFVFRAAAQFTTVTGTVIDPNGVPYALGTITANLVSSASPTLNGLPYTPPTQPAGLDKTGSFSFNLADNTQLQPAGTKWNFTVCSAVGTVQPAIGTGSQCFTLAAPITISGATQSITTQLHAAALALTVPLGSGGGSPPAAPIGSVQTNLNGIACGFVSSVGNGSAIVSNGSGAPPIYQTKPIYDTRDWMTCDGNGTTGTDASAGMNNLLSVIGTTEATIRFVGSTTASATCRVGNTFFGPNITLDFSGGGAIQLISSSTAIGGGTYVNGTSVECGAGTTCSLPALSITPGNTIAVMEAPYPGFTFKTTRVTDNCGNFYIHVFQSLANQPRNQGLWIASSAQSPGGTCTITATANGSLTTHMMLAAQIAGMGPVTSIDASASNNAVGTTMSSGAVTTLTGAFLLAFGGQPFTAETCTVGAGYTQPAGIAGQSTNGFICAEYQNASAGGSTSATQNINNSASWVFSLVSLKPGNATATIWGGINDPDLHQIFYNADGATGHGVVDLTGGTVLQAVYPEWWGASPNDFAGTTNTPAIQAAEYAAFGCGPLQCRTSASGLSIYNRELKFSTVYNINDEIKFYHVNGFLISGLDRLQSGINQTSVNKRILVGDAISYGVIQNLSFSTQAGEDGTHPLVLLDYTGTIGADTKNQFIDVKHVNFIGNGVAAIGLQNSSGGAAQGSNINCLDCAFQNFTQAAEQIGTPSSLAQNALDNSVIQGDIQGCPNFGIAVYGGNVTVRDMTFENGFTTQTGFDVLCSASQFFCYIQSVRSESRRLASGANLVIKNSKTLDQGLFPTPGTGFPVGTIFTSQTPGGDGKYYKVTVDTSPLGGVGTPGTTVFASGGSTTTLVNTNQTMSGSNTIKTFVLGETLTQAVTGSTATLLAGTTSTGTITGSVSSGAFLFGETITQSVTGVTALVLAPTPTGTQNLLANNFSGTADNSHVWTGGTSGATYTPTAAPTFSVLVMTITAATGAPDNTHNWTGGTSGAVYVPTTTPVGPGYTVNGFAGFRATIMAGTNANCYGVITSNTATTITVTAWLTNFQFVSCTAPDSTSTFIVEPNWGTQFTSGGVTWVDLNENGIDGGSGTGVSTIVMENVDIPGDRINLVGPNVVFNNVTVTRNDWANLTGGNQYSSWNAINNVLDVQNRTIGPSNAGSRYQPWSLPKVADAGTVVYSGSFQQNLGSKPIVWSAGSGGGVPKAADDVWIGGRSDPSSKNDHTRAILEYGGLLGPATPFGTDQPGTTAGVTGGLSTGAGAPGDWCASTGTTGASGTQVNDGAQRWCVKGATGNLVASTDNTQSIGAPGTNRPSAVYTLTTNEGDPSFGSSTTNTSAACETSYGATTLSTIATTTDTGLSCLPANAIIDSVVYRITTTITTAASFTIGDATTAARFCGTQSTLTTGTTGICFVQADQTGAPGPRQTAAAKVRVTTNVNPGAGVIRLIVYYHTWTAPTS